MRQSAPSKRGRGRSGGRRSFGGPGNRSYDSNGPDVKIRGTAMHIFDKYQALARDASASGDRIAAENYLQHAEHYYRLMNANSAQRNGQNRGNGQQQPTPPGEARTIDPGQGGPTDFAGSGSGDGREDEEVPAAESDDSSQSAA